MVTHTIVTVVNIEIFVMIVCRNILLLIIISIVSRIADNIL